MNTAKKSRCCEILLAAEAYMPPTALPSGYGLKLAIHHVFPATSMNPAWRSW